MARQTTIPVTLLTRFLGSGKTTLLNQMLADRRMRHAAVIINEFGSVSLDHDLVHKGSERYVVTTTGCLCCTATSDVRTSLFELQEMVHRGEAHPFDRVIVETTSLADPAPIVNSLVPGGAPSLGFRDHTIAKSFRLSNVVSTFDAEAGEAALDQHIEAWKQVAFADDVVIDGGRATRSKGRRDVPDNSHRTDTVRIAAPEGLARACRRSGAANGRPCRPASSLSLTTA